MTATLTFYLNGKTVALDDPSPDLLLLDYLRSSGINLTGAKKGCGQGGCGSCTTVLSWWDVDNGEVRQEAINSCLRPVCSLAGMVVTTVEGTISAHKLAPNHPKHAAPGGRQSAPANVGVPAFLDAQIASAVGRLEAVEESPVSQAWPRQNPVALRLAANNGTQCGYCSTGFVMGMTGFLLNNPDATKKQIEGALDGNICRCTGYRSILTGMKTFASDWNKADEKARMPCILEDGIAQSSGKFSFHLDFPDAAKAGPSFYSANKGQQSWFTPQSIEELLAFLKGNAERSVYLLHANTAYGIYPQDFLQAEFLVDLSRIASLRQLTRRGDQLHVGASTTYTQLLQCLEQLETEEKLPETSLLSATRYMASRTAGTIVRNVATISGNTMLVLKHIHSGSGAPFPSDLLTALCCIGARVNYVDFRSGLSEIKSVEELVNAARDDNAFAESIVIVNYEIPLVEKQTIAYAQKVALREVNAHSIVNATSMLRFSGKCTVSAANLTLGGLLPYPWCPKETCAELVALGKLSLTDVSGLLDTLRKEISTAIKPWEARLGEVPDSGLGMQYKTELALSFLYKSIINALDTRDPKLVPAAVRSAGRRTWGGWPVSNGAQAYSHKDQDYKAPVATPLIKLSALYQTSGEIRYTHDIPVSSTGLNAAFVTSRMPLANFHWTLPDSSRPADFAAVYDALKSTFEDLYSLITYRDIPIGGVNNQGIGGDRPLLADDEVRYVGQAVAVVLCHAEKEAQRIADFIAEKCIGYEPVDWAPEWREPVLTLEDAINRNSVFADAPASMPHLAHIWKIIRPGSLLNWVTKKDPLDIGILARSALIGGRACNIIEGTQRCGSQIHFYMETQSAVSEPLSEERLRVHPSAQSPADVHNSCKQVLNVNANDVEISLAQVGGAYGGKFEPAQCLAAVTALAARHVNRAVRLVMPRAEDSRMSGKRHAYYAQYQVAIDTGLDDAKCRGVIRGIDNKLWGDGGAYYDVSFMVSDCMQMRADNAYYVANYSSQIDVCRTNIAPSTAMRSFGDIQGKVVTESAIDDAAFSLGMDPACVREINMYRRGDVTPFGQALNYCYMREVWSYLREKSDYDQRRKDAVAWNRKNKWRKRGVYMVPVKYGSGYNLLQMEQAAATVSVYASDGSVMIHQGGVDMGQGMITKVTQIAAYVLGIPLDMVHVKLPRTSVIPNAAPTGASTGTAYNGEAVKQTCEKLRKRLLAFGQSMLKEYGDEWCIGKGIDYWNYGSEGWAATVLNPTTGVKHLIWQNLIGLAQQNRVGLVECFNTRIMGGDDPVSGRAYKPVSEQPVLPGIPLASDVTQISSSVDKFVGFTYSAACAEVEVDILTGETKILHAELVYDVGWSLNQALDIGQVEGAFVQGIGYLLTENVVYQQDGPEAGTLNTDNTWTYKPPAVTTIPLQMNVTLFPRDLADVPENPNTLLSSKEVGEPPLVLATCVFLAVKEAVRASRIERNLDGLFRLDAPATVQEVRRACALDLAAETQD